MKTLIKNGIIIDGSGKKRFSGNILIQDGRIAAIGDFNGEVSDRIIDAQGLVVSPGFIDTHSHSDLKILEDPFIMPKVVQGITCEVLGQDGIAMAPLPLEHISTWKKNLAGLAGSSDTIDWEYKTTDGYLSLLEQTGIGLNVSCLAPHGNIRMEAMGLENREPTVYELEKMKDILKRELEAGAIGLSTGLIYIPCAYAKTEELIELCKVAQEYDRVFVIHQRSEADSILDSMQEVIRIGRETGVKIHFSHFKVCGKKNWSKIEKVIKMLEKAHWEGIRISFDQYPYVAGSTMLGAILPPWVHDGGTEKMIERLKKLDLRKKIIDDIEKGIPGWDNFVDFAGLDQIYITSVKTEKNIDLIGRNLVEIGKIKSKSPYDAAFDLLCEEENAVGMVDFYGLEDHVIRFLKLPEQNVCTDGLLGGKPHPRAYGTFPRVLGRYVREKKALTLEEAISKMTSKPAEVFNLKGRGTLVPGNYADIVIFDPETIIDKGTYTHPDQYPEGIEYVIINGDVAVEKGTHKNITNGRVIRA